MTSTTTAAKAASNGKNESAPQRERKSGMARVHESVAYHLASVAHDAACEAEWLCSDIYRTVSGAYLQRGGTVSEAAEAASSEDTLLKANDAVRCLNAAQSNLRQLAAHGRSGDAWSAEPRF